MRILKMIWLLIQVKWQTIVQMKHPVELGNYVKRLEQIRKVQPSRKSIEVPVNGIAKIGDVTIMAKAKRVGRIHNKNCDTCDYDPNECHEACMSVKNKDLRYWDGRN